MSLIPHETTLHGSYRKASMLDSLDRWIKREQAAVNKLTRKAESDRRGKLLVQYRKRYLSLMEAT